MNVKKWVKSIQTAGYNGMRTVNQQRSGSTFKGFVKENKQKWRSEVILVSIKVRQIRNDFFKPTFLPKNERTNSTLLLVDLFLFVFCKKVKTPKRHFKIN